MAVLAAVTGGLAAEDAVSVKLDQSGAATISRGGVELGVIELNAHGPQWKHAPQATGAARPCRPRCRPAPRTRARWCASTCNGRWGGEVTAVLAFFRGWARARSARQAAIFIAF